MIVSDRGPYKVYIQTADETINRQYYSNQFEALSKFRDLCHTEVTDHPAAVVIAVNNVQMGFYRIDRGYADNEEERMIAFNDRLLDFDISR